MMKCSLNWPLVGYLNILSFQVWPSSLFKNTSWVLLIYLLSSATASAEENTLNVYTYDSFSSKWGPGPQIKENFEKYCDCTLQFIAVDSSAGLLNRIQLEGPSSPADVVLGLDNSLLAEAEASGLLRVHRLDTQDLVLPVEWNNPLFIPFDYGYFAFIYDGEKIQQPPVSMRSLVDAPDDLKILIQDPRSSTPGLGLLLWVKSIYGDRSEAIWNKLSPKIVTVTSGWSEAYGMFLKGEADMVLSYTTSPAYHMINEGKTQYQAAAFNEGHGMQIEVAALLKNSPHPRLAEKFMAFILEADFQSAIPTGNWMYPVTELADGLPKEFKELVQPESVLLLDTQEVKKHKRKWIDEFSRALSR